MESFNTMKSLRIRFQLQGFTFALFLLFPFPSSAVVSTPEETVPAIIQKSSQAVWKLNNNGVDGSGLVFRPRIMATNFHVVTDLLKNGSLSDITLSQNGKPEGLKIQRIVALSPLADIALLEVDREVPYLPLPEESFFQDEDLFVLGYPQGTFAVMKQTGAFKQFPGVSEFPVDHTDFFGASGGAVVDSKGWLVGMLKEGSRNFAYSVSVAKLKGVFSGEMGLQCVGFDSEECVKEAVRFAIEKGMEGTPEDKHGLGGIYREGLGVDQSFKQAFDWFEQAALQGHVLSQNKLGFMYEEGLGVDQSFEKAVYWYEKAALQGLASAQFNLGAMYREGLGMDQSPEKAAYWFEQAVLQGFAPAQYNLGSMYDWGWGVDQSFEKAVYWYEKAALQGHILSQRNLGIMYERGWGVDQSPEKAAYWYEKAVLQGYAPAHLKSLREFLNR